MFALEHFDLFYRPVYEKLWPSIRIALLTTSKYCAVINNFTDTGSVERRMFRDGAYDIIETAAVRLKANQDKTRDQVMASAERRDPVSGSNIPADTQSGGGYTYDSPDDETSELEETEEDQSSSESAEYVVFDERKDLDSMNIDSFMPAKTVYTDAQQLRLEELEQSVYTPSGININVVAGSVALPNQLHVLTFPKGSTREFFSQQQMQESRRYSHYLMTAASVLPVVALDLQPSDIVLDLCAAPGGKALTLLQTRITERIVFNDSSSTRSDYLQKTIGSYVPAETYGKLEFYHKDGTTLHEEMYDKVLVDVPCSADRQIVTEEDNKYYMPSMVKHRVEMLSKQKNLLVAAIKSCVPGGSVVYCTGTLSPAQNDNIIEQAFEEMWQQTNINIVVEDLSELTKCFTDTYTFYKGCRYGQLVLPDLVANFGPMYFCKINRLT